MYKITEKRVKDVLSKMINKNIEITIEGSIRISKKINNLDYFEESEIINLIDKETKEYIIFNLNETYSRMVNKRKDIIQANIDGINNDTQIVIKECKKTEWI